MKTFQISAKHISTALWDRFYEFMYTFELQLWTLYDVICVRLCKVAQIPAAQAQSFNF